MWELLWSWILAHASQVGTQVVATASGLKTIADATESIKKLAPERLESKEVAKQWVEASVTLLNDPAQTIENKRWEIEARSEMVHHLLHAETIEASYFIARYAIFSGFTAFVFYLLVKLVTGRYSRTNTETRT